MKIRLYLDEDAMDGNLVWALRVRGLDVVTALDSGLIHTPDAKHLEYASLDGRTVYSFNVGDWLTPARFFIIVELSLFRSGGESDILSAPCRQLCRRHMAEVNNQLQSLRYADSDVARILDVCDEIARVYNAALEAMGVESSKSDFVTSSADVTISLRPSESVQSLTLLNG